jgi:hypothetical protein
MFRAHRAAISSLALVGGLMAGAPGVLAAGATVSTMPATGTAFACLSGTYTVTAGTLHYVLQQGTSASGNTEITGTVTPQGVVLKDASGSTYSLAGASWFGETFNAQTGVSVMTETADFQVLKPGSGVVANVQQTFHVDSSGTVSAEKGSCASPE